MLMGSDLHVLAKPTLPFPRKIEEYAAQPVPNLQEFKQLWAAWDTVTRCMIPEDELLSKPIRLRNCCIFYLGHIPTFLDIHLTRATGQGPTSPKSYQTIFERGIDPDVDDPEHCHAHSEIPDTWPPVTEIIHYQARVRSRVRDLFSNGDTAIPGDVGRALWLGFEHEGEAMPLLLIGRRVRLHSYIAMHLETLLYMLLQSDWIVPPPGRVPSFEALAQEAEQATVSNQWIKIPATAILVGMDSPENDHGLARYFGWDNEKPMRRVHVPAFETKARPLTNEDFARYLCETNRATLPASWIRTSSGKGDINHANGRIGSSDAPGLNGPAKPLVEAFLGGKFIRTVYGPVPLQYALAWPVFASYDELAGCAQWMDGRIPTAEEVRSIYSHVDLAKKREAEKVQARKISAVNG